MTIKRVAVIGASGYGGLQSLKLLQSHPNFEIGLLGGERSAGKRRRRAGQPGLDHLLLHVTAGPAQDRVVKCGNSEGLL